MSKLSEEMKKLKATMKKHKRLCALLVCGVAFGGGNAYYGHIKYEEAKAEQAKIYDLKKADDLYTIKGDKLKNVTSMIVVSSSANSPKAVVVKEKNRKKVAIYEDVPLESFYLYKSTILEPYIKETKAVDFRYMKDFKDIHERLGVANDPKAVKQPQLENGNSGILASLANFLFIGLILWGFIYFNGRSITSSADVIDPKKLTDDLDDLVGLQDIKEELLQLEDMIRNQELYSKYNLRKKFNVMMTGPAGVGKTKMARCLAKRLSIPLIYASAASLQSGYVGGGPRALKNLYKKASRHKRAIIFLDEAESLLMSRVGNGVKDYERDTINALLALLDGVNTKDSEVIWIVASNMDEHKVQMDDAMLRRFQLKINFRLPNFEERKEILERLVSKLDKDTVSPETDLNKIASVSSGMSPAILETMVSRASLIAIQEKALVSQEILMKAYERVAVGLTDRETTANMEEKRLLVARHEAGHFIMKLDEALTKSAGELKNLHDYIDVIKISTESVSKMGALGFVLSKEKELKLENLNDYENQIKQLYGGMVNEELYYNNAGVTAGAHNDIEKVSNLLRVMVCEVGYYQNQKLNYAVLNKNGGTSETQIKQIEEVSIRLYNETKATLKEYTGLTDLLVEKLMTEYILNVDDALEIASQYFGSNQLLVKYLPEPETQVA